MRLELARNPREQLVAPAQIRLGQAPGIAVRGAVHETAVAAHETAVGRLEELHRIPRMRDEAVLVRMNPVRVDGVRPVVGHVGERLTRIRREEHCAVVGDVLAVLVGAAEIDDVGPPGGV